LPRVAQVQQLINQAIAANNTEVVGVALRELNHTLAPNCVPFLSSWTGKSQSTGESCMTEKSTGKVNQIILIPVQPGTGNAGDNQEFLNVKLPPSR